MAGIPLTLACIDYFDRTRPIIERQIPTPGIDLIPVPLSPKQLDVRFREFDVAEMIMTLYMALKSRGDERYIAIPVFPYRAYHLGNVVVNVASGIQEPKDLRGKKVAIRRFHLAATLWIRGFLQHTYGIERSHVHWFSAGRPKFNLPADLKIDVVDSDAVLTEMLQTGQVDAWIGASLPECFKSGSSRVRRLFPKYREVEEEFAKRTGFFPIIHTVVIRRELYEHHPWIAKRLVEIFEQAREIGAMRLDNEGVSSIGLPWIKHDLEQLGNIFGGDWYRNGFSENQKILATMARYAFEQGLTPSEIDMSHLFAPETL
jgi:4,5-dihydroxyphthalate decarboxylase